MMGSSPNFTGSLGNWNAGREKLMCYSLSRLGISGDQSSGKFESGMFAERNVSKLGDIQRELGGFKGRKRYSQTTNMAECGAEDNYF
jgi:hypothetical protein